MRHQFAWSVKTFGPARGSAGVIDHIRKELEELDAKPDDLEEWVDILILACDGAMREGHTPNEIVHMWEEKQAKNERRKWPDWRLATPGKAIEHVRGIHD